MVFHDHRLTLLQFTGQGEACELLGFNEVELDSGIVENSEIISMDQFQYALSDLFTEAQPNPINATELCTNIPYHLLYTFVEDFSHKSKKSSDEAAMLAKVREHSPIEIEDLSLEYHSREKGHKLSYAAYASPKKWQSRLLKACKKIGVSSINFVPEPLSHIALSPQIDKGDFALFSFHESQVFLSIFHNGLIYDSYFLSDLNDISAETCASCFNEFSNAQEDFYNHFNKKISSLYFVGFDKAHAKMIRDHFENQALPLNFLDGEESPLAKLMPYESKRASLFGLFNVLVLSQEKD